MRKILICIVMIVGALAITSSYVCAPACFAAEETQKKEDFIKWVDFNVTCEAMKKAIALDVESQNKEVKINYIVLLACLATRNGNNFSHYKDSQLSAIAEKIKTGEAIEKVAGATKYYKYYYESIGAVLSGFVGDYETEVPDETGSGKHWEKRYGLKAFSPIAKGYYYNHYDDFGKKRSYGFSRPHLGNDLMGNTGSPVIAVESGTVEALGWNQYGGWRIGIRSFDSKRYYYYAHLRKNFPYRKDLAVGSSVKAGDVIGYLGHSGYSTKENVNNINTPHLHFGMQLVFDESQKECNSEIWINVYEIVNLLENRRSAVVKDPETKEYHRVWDFRDLSGYGE